eukprot:scaffold4.g5040.t1
MIYCAGVGSLHYACWNDDLAYPQRQALSYAAGLVPFSSCAYTYGWYWFLCFFDFVTLASVVGVLACPVLRPARLGALLWLGVVTTLIIESGRTYLFIHYQLPGGAFVFDPAAASPTVAPAPLTARAAKCAVAGAILVSVANLLLGLALACQRCVPGTTGQCCKAPQPVDKPSSDGAAQAFLTAVATKEAQQAPPV